MAVSVGLAVRAGAYTVAPRPSAPSRAHAHVRRALPNPCVLVLPLLLACHPAPVGVAPPAPPGDSIDPRDTDGGGETGPDTADDTDPPGRPWPENNVILGWGDNRAVYGPGTDPALDSEEAVRAMVRRWKAQGYTGIYFRTDPMFYADNGFHVWNEGISGNLVVMTEGDREVAQRVDVLAVAADEARAQGIELWGWHTTLFSNGGPAACDWAFEVAYGAEHPEVYSVDRDGRSLYGAWELADPDARAAKIAELTWLAEHTGISDIYLSLRTEAFQATACNELPRAADQYGFNTPVAADTWANRGVDILTDARFDIDSPSWDPTDPEVEAWHALRGAYLTTFLRELQVALRAVNPDSRVVVSSSGGDYIGPPLGNMVLDWRTWVEEGLVDGLVLGTDLGGGWSYPDASVCDKGYLTVDGHCSPSTLLDVSVFREAIDASAHPEVRLVTAGGSAYEEAAPYEGTDGWQTGNETDSTWLAWTQREAQLRADVADFGAVAWLTQDFDSVAPGWPGYDGYAGQASYQPSTRTSTGVLDPVCVSPDTCASVQDAMAEGGDGNALRIETGATTARYLFFGRTGITSLHDAVSASPDTLPTTGTVTASLRIYQPAGAPASADVYLNEYGTAAWGIGVHVEPSGVLYRSDGVGAIVRTGVVAPVGAWHTYTFRVDLDAATYSLWLGDADTGTPVATDVAYAHSSRAVSGGYLGVGVEPGASAWFDDVRFAWDPESPLVQVEAAPWRAGSFAGATGDAIAADADLVVDGACAVDAFLSIGEEVGSARCEGASAVRWGADDPVAVADVATLDLDVLVGDEGTFEVAIEGASGPVLTVRGARGGQWETEDAGGSSPSALAVPDNAWGYPLWTHLQLAVLPSDGTWQVAAQVVGSAPVVLAEGTLAEDARALHVAWSSTGTVFIDNVSMAGE